ncbi:MAG TPA: serine/threonine-protein kinase [Pirellulales bacterium]|nr:serine/threonine-protein kinase [Pirellulales bacterium]
MPQTIQRPETSIAASQAAPLAQLGAWQLVKLIGEGRLCRVYAARPIAHSPSRPTYALKVLKERWQEQPTAIEVMRREAIVGKKVSHPHVISVLSAHVGAPPYFLVMPLLEGASLDRRLAAGERTGIATALWIARQTAEALGALHAAGWMHADVKPANIFLSADGHATLLDLGFARQPTDSTSLVQRCVTGTMQYIAPEMITSALRPDIRSDIYSLGATLYEMLTGGPPFVADGLEQLATLHRAAEPRPLRLHAPQVPAKVARFVHQMLAKEPLRRPQTPQDVIDRLVDFEIETFDMR